MPSKKPYSIKMAADKSSMWVEVKHPMRSLKLATPAQLDAFITDLEKVKEQFETRINVLKWLHALPIEKHEQSRAH